MPQSFAEFTGQAPRRQTFGEFTAPADTGPDAADLGTLGAGAAGLAALGIASRKPGLIGKAASKLGAARQQLMLSGLALPKSILGNIGGTAVASAERGTLEPLRQLFSRQTLRDVREAYRTLPARTDPSYGTTLPGPTPGRVMGAVDEGTRKALTRAGLTDEEAAAEILQAPLTGRLASALESPAARYLIPFRRTPFNQFIEGFETLKGGHPAVLGTALGAGAVHGAATADERYPLSLGLGTAAAARYGLPYVLGAVGGRTLSGARTSAGIAGSALPVSEYGLTSSVEAPTRPFTEPALLRLLFPRRP